MAMSATTTASAIVVATISTATIASASVAGEHVDHTLNLLVGSGTILHNFADEGEVLASQAVIEVDDNLLILHLQYEALEMVAVLVYQGYECTWVDVF